jgi:hypothetical protein
MIPTTTKFLVETKENQNKKNQLAFRISWLTVSHSVILLPDTEPSSRESVSPIGKGNIG